MLRNRNGYAYLTGTGIDGRSVEGEKLLADFSILRILRNLNVIRK